MKSITSNNLMKLISKETFSDVILDIRERSKYELSHIPNSINIPSDILQNDLANYLNHDYTYYIICEYGLASPKITTLLTNKGYNTYNVTGGLNKWAGKLISGNF